MYYADVEEYESEENFKILNGVKEKPHFFYTITGFPIVGPQEENIFQFGFMVS